MALQAQAFRTGYDEKGLFLWNTPAELGVLAVCAAAIVLLILVTGKAVPEGGSYERLFPQNWFCSATALLGGGMLALDIVYALEPVPGLLLVLGLAAAAGMALGGVCRAFARRPHWLCHGAVCVYLMLRLLAEYRAWGSSAHLERYAFPMLAQVMLMLYAFHRCAADAGLIRRRRMILTGFGAAVCSLAALSDPADRVYYLAMVIWTLGSMCTTSPVPEQSEHS